MSIDVASLVFEIDSTQAVTARERLERLEAAGLKVDASARKIKSATELAGIGMRDATESGRKLVQTATELAASEGAVERATQTSLTRQGVSWREFVSQRMGDYMRLEGGHSAAMKRIGAEWQAYKATATDAAQGAATAMIASQGAVEKATRQAGQASADTRAQRALEAAAMRELVLATKAYERDQAAAAREQAAAIASLEARIFALKSSIDPTFAAQSRLNAEMQEAASLYKAGAISAEQYAAATRVLDDRFRMAAVANDAVTKSMRHTRLAGVDLGRQFADVGVQAAMMTNPLMILVMQGPHIVDRLTDMKAQGIGLSAAMKSLAVSTWAALAPLAPFVLGVGAVAGVIGGTLALAARDLNQDNKDLVASLGLTEKQLDRLKDKGVDTGVTIGDVFKGTFDYIRDAVAPSLAPVGKWFSDLFDEITAKGVWAVKTIGGAFVGAFAAIKEVWGRLPAALGDIAVQAGNAVVRAIENTINKALEAYNKALPAIRALMTAIGNASGAMGLREAGPMSLGQMDNPWSGAAQGALEEGAAAFKKANEGWSDTVDSVGAGLRMSILDATAERIRKGAGDADKPSKTPKGPADRSDEELLRLEQALAAARAEELQAQLALTEDVRARAELEKQLLDIQLDEKRAELAKQAAKIERDVAQKRITEATGDLMRLELAALELSAARVASLKAELIEREALRNVIRNEYAIIAGGLQIKIDAWGTERDLAQFAYQRREIDKKILQHQQMLERLKLQEIIDTTAAGTVEHEIAKARLEVLDKIHANQRESAFGRAEDAYNDLARHVGDAVRAFEEQDWKTLVISIVDAFQRLKEEFAKAGNAAGKMSAVAGVASVVGQSVGGKAGGALQGGASAAMAAAAFTANPLIIAGAAIVGGIKGWLDGGKAEKAAKAQREAQDIENARRVALERANQQAELELRILELSGDEVGALTKKREAEIAALDASNRALQQYVYALEDWEEAVGKAKSAVSKAEDDLRDAYNAEKQRLEGIIGGVQAARDRLNDAYQRERAAIEKTADSVRSLIEQLADFRSEIDMMSAANDPSGQYGYAQRQFLTATNDNLIERGRAFANASQSASATDLDFQRDLAAVRRRTDEASKTATEQLTTAERQLQALDAMVAPLLAVNDNLLSVEQAIQALATAEMEAAIATEELARLDAQVGALITINSSVLSVAQAIANLNGAIAALAAAEAAKPANNPGSGYQAVGFGGYVDMNADLAALYASGSGMARGRTKEEFGQYHWERYGQAESRAYRPFARGGDHSGGLRLVGEEGPELEATGPSRIFSARQTAEMLRGDNSDLQQELRAIRQELASLRKERAEDARQIKQNTKDISTAMAKVTQGGDTVRVTEVAA